MMWPLVLAVAIQAPQAEKAPPPDDQLRAYAESLANAPDAVAWSLDKDGQLQKIYAGYFSCYRASLDRDPRSALRDTSAATLAFKGAYAACSSLREDADRAAIAYAARDTDLKRADERRRAIEYYRSWRGQIMLREYYQQRGKSAEFRRYVDEMTRASERGQ